MKSDYFMALPSDRAGGPTDLSRDASQPEALIPSALYEALGDLVSECADQRDIYPDDATALQVITDTVNEIYASIQDGVFGRVVAATPYSFLWSEAELSDRAVELVRSMAAVKCKNKYPVGVIGAEARAHYSEARNITQAMSGGMAKTDTTDRFVLVPREPTEAMYLAAFGSDPWGGKQPIRRVVDEIWSAMICAAQGIEAATADETQRGSAVGESPVVEDHAPEPCTQTHTTKKKGE